MRDFWIGAESQAWAMYICEAIEVSACEQLKVKVCLSGGSA